MKKLFVLIGLVLGFTIQVMAQTTPNDFTIVGQSSNDGNMRQIEKRYQHRVNTCFITDSEINAIDQIGVALATKGKVENLHIYLKTSPGELIFSNSTILTINNINDFSMSLQNWKQYVSGKVVIHSHVVFDQPEGLQLRKNLETLSGLQFIFKR